MTACILSNCTKESESFKEVKKAEKNAIYKKCNPEKKNLTDLEKDERKKIKQCFKENRCEREGKIEDSKEFETLKICAGQKCPNDLIKSNRCKGAIEKDPRQSIESFGNHNKTASSSSIESLIKSTTKGYQTSRSSFAINDLTVSTTKKANLE